MKERFKAIFDPDFRRKKNEERFLEENRQKVEKMGEEASLIYKARAEAAQQLIEQYHLAPTNSEKVLGGTEELILVNAADFKRYIWGRRPSAIRLYSRGPNDHGGIWTGPKEENLMVACDNPEITPSSGESSDKYLMRVLDIQGFSTEDGIHRIIKIDWSKAPA